MAKRHLEPQEDDFCTSRDHALIYQQFYSLDQANQYATEYNVPVFALDKPKPQNPGAKVFIASSYDMLWKRYLDLRPEQRCFYETLLELFPCHFHVDAEYNKASNPDANENQLDEVLQTKCALLMIELGYIERVQDLHVTTLVSSNEKKVSRHYIFKMAGRYFLNNYHCGAFARRLASRLDESFFLWSEKKTKACYMDMSIYTKRRQFRLYLSTKASGPYRPLLPESLHQETHNYTKEIRVEPNKDQFLTSLIQRVDSTWTPIRCTELDGSEPGSGTHKQAKREDVEERIPRVRDRLGSTPCIHASLMKLIETMRSSRVKNEGSLHLQLYHYSKDKDLFVYESSSRTCEIKLKKTGESTHNGNHIYFVVLLGRKCFWQKCYNETTCDDQRSEPYHFPLDFDMKEYYAEKKRPYQSKEFIGRLVNLFDRL